MWIYTPLVWCFLRSDAIYSAMYNGSGLIEVLRGHEYLSHPFAVTMYGGEVYWTDWRTNTLAKANKWTGHNVTVVQRTNTQPFDLQVYHPSRQPLGRFHSKYKHKNKLCHWFTSLALDSMKNSGGSQFIEFLYTSSPKTADLLKPWKVLFAHTRAIWTPQLPCWFKSHLTVYHFPTGCIRYVLISKECCNGWQDGKGLSQEFYSVLPFLLVTIFVLWAQALGSLVCEQLRGAVLFNEWRDNRALNERLADSLNHSSWQWWDKLCWQIWQPEVSLSVQYP